MLDTPRIEDLFKIHNDQSNKDHPNKDFDEFRSDTDNQGHSLNSDFLDNLRSQQNLPNQDNLPNKDFHKDRFVRAKYVRNRFSISDPTLHRWVKAGKLPRPQYLNTQRVWRLSAIEAAEQQMLASEERVDNHF